MVAVPFMAFARKDATGLLENDKIVLTPILVEELCSSNNSYIQEFKLCHNHKASGRSSESNQINTHQYAHAVLSESGTLASVLGDRIFEIDSISVEGPMNDDDFNTLWESSFNGQLKIINLENATVENGIIPQYALFHINEQVNWETMVITTTWLEKLLLPEGVTEIGDFAVAYSISLREIKFPGTLQSIGRAAFTDCIDLTSEQLAFPENLKVIGEQAFYYCHGLTGKITLPESLLEIKCAAFYSCKISEINIPRSLEYLGCMAFAGSRFKKAFLPNNCYLCPQGGEFYNNWELTEVHLPDNLPFVPESIFSGCISLQQANVPSRAITIGEFAFDGTKIAEIDFPETLESIGQDAFQGCRQLNSVILPSSLKSIGDRAFALCSNLKSIYCKATVPPAYIPAQGYEFDGSPFASVNKSTPVFIPTGTKQQYTTAPGWDYMTNFIETDNFPSAGIGCVTMNGKEQYDYHTYDLSGRKVEAPAPGNIYISNGKKILIR